MNKFYTYIILSMYLVVVGCNTDKLQKTNHKKNTINADLDSIKSSGTLKAFLNYNPTSYFIFKGNPMGFDYELLKIYSAHIGVELKVIPIKNLDSVFVELNRGKVDIVADNLTITEERLIHTNFTTPILVTQQVLIQRKPENWQKLKKSELKKSLLQTPIDLIGKTVTIRKGSSFYSRIKSLSNEVGGKINIQAVNEFTMEDLLEKVAYHEIDYTVADKNLALVNQWQFPNIDASLSLSLDQNIAWSVRKNAKVLTHSVNEWLNEFKKSKKFNLLYAKYFKNKRSFNKRISHKYYTLKSGKISPYDIIIQKHASKLGWDWELLAAMIYQESHFNNNAKGWGGSFGLMQLMPKTGLKFGVDSLSSAEENIIAGIKYLKYLDDYWTPIITNDNQRIKFVLASYNVGPGHILDARRLADKYGKDPFIWDNNVDYYLLNKSKAKYYKDKVVRNGYCKGYITYEYVNQISERYEHYKNILQESNLSNNDTYSVLK